ncbi:MAG: hypothetical protein AABX89_02220 [Candidatus Thermoplasmatota archaeon]
MAERRIRYLLVWPLFIAVMIAGAALVSMGGTALIVGLVILGAPLVALASLSILYYVRERIRRRPKA